MASAATSRSPPAPTRRPWSARRRPPGARSSGSAPTPSPPTRCSASMPSSPWSRPPPRPARAASPPTPLLGLDALEPLVAAAAEAGAGVFALVRTSNPGAADVQDLPAPHQPLHERFAGLVDGLSERLLGECGMSGMGAVVGATEPLHIAHLRELMPRSIFLIPGVGAQGGKPELLGAAFSAGRASALIAASRGIAADPDPAAAAERLRATVWDVSSA